MSSLPDSYIHPIHLPFNYEPMRARFQLQTPDRDPGGAGFWVVLQKSKVLVVNGPQGLELPLADKVPVSQVVSAPIFFGFWDGRPCRVVRLGRDGTFPNGATVVDIMANDPGLEIDLLSLIGTAGQILHWDRIGQYCSLCGSEMERMADEWGQKCAKCGHAHFPHIHPCIIVAVSRGDELLLARKPEWAPNRYSLVAGFLDFGECLEEAVVREVREETGIEVSNIRYVGSQSWPFPSQLMAGFTADYAGGEIVVEEKELEDVRWFKADALPNLPPKRSISRFLIDAFVSSKMKK